MLSSCSGDEMASGVVVQNTLFTVAPDSVVQDTLLARCTDDFTIITNYDYSPADAADTVPAAKKLPIAKFWKGKPQTQAMRFTSQVPIANACHNMAIETVLRHKSNGYSDSRTSLLSNPQCYAICLALAYLDPEGSKKMLLAMTRDGKIVSGSTPAPCPASHAHLVWTAAAWEVYNVTGDKKWLKTAMNVCAASLDSTLKIMAIPDKAVVCGPAGYNANYFGEYYPHWMNDGDVQLSASLNTNIIVARTHQLLALMAEELDVSVEDNEKRAEQLKDDINHDFWDESRNRYNMVLCGGVNRTAVPHIDNFGQSLSMLCDIADDNRTDDIIDDTPMTHYGTPWVYPGSDGQQSRFTRRSSLLLQSLWTLSAARADNVNVVRRGLGAMLRAQALFATCAYDWDSQDGTPIADGANELCNAAGAAAMACRVLAGITFQPEGIEFNPVVPVCFAGTKRIENLAYRKALLNITIEGVGTEVGELKLDGKKLEGNFVEGSLQGVHEITITLKGNARAGNANIVSSLPLLPAEPVVEAKSDSLIIPTFDASSSYVLMMNGKRAYSLSDSIIHLPDTTHFTQYSVAVVTRRGMGDSSRPLYVMPHPAILDVPNFVQASPVIVAIDDSTSVHATRLDDEIQQVVVPYFATNAGVHYISLDYYFDASGIALCQILANGHHQGIMAMTGNPVNPAMPKPLIYPLKTFAARQTTDVLAVKLLKGKNKIAIKLLNTQAAPLVATLKICAN